MSAIIDLRAFLDRSSVPLLVLVDLQQGYVETDRPGSNLEFDVALANCRAALGHARAKGFPLAFVRRRASDGGRRSRWIGGLEPTGIDMIFDREAPSCYASPRFAEVIGQAGGRFALAGLSGEAACLATAVDALHRGHNVTYLADASASRGLGDIGAHDVHRVVEKIVGLYGDTIATATWIAATGRLGSMRGRQTWTMA